MTKILLDMNYPKFQEQLFSLEKVEQRALLNTLKKIKLLRWETLYSDKGIRWELITSKQTSKGNNLYSFRFSQKYRGTAYRDGDYMVLLGLFPDHDGAYIN
ncbi:hypothetical protein NOVO_02050 [Rickettsiales bacterium Ac37b]|nr:hypothetical protein NOVO_02050 [Rickettsiales bacterium Ac37b]